MANNTSIGVVVGKKNLEDLNKLNTELKKSNELLQAQIKILADVNKQYAGAKNTTQLKAALNKQEQANVTIQKSQKTITEKNTALQKERIRVENQKKTILAKTLALEEKGTKTLIKGQERLKIARKKAREEAQKALGVNKKSNGLFRSMAKSMIAVGVAAIGIRTVFNVFKNNLKTIANFEEAMSKVKAVTGVLPKEFKQLSDNAKMLGSTTSKTATEVAGLQLEFSKLGFSTQEILNATEATISLSIAAGSDLAESAVVAASTIRGFGLDASEAQRVVDVMAKSFASSALDLEKFKTSMAAVAPVAKANGKDIEFVTSQLSVLSDAGLDASTSGTSLRNMFLNLSKEGLTWEQGLAKINNSTNKNVTALDLFGKRGATAALILADNIEKAEGLEKAYDRSAGSAKKMADIMEDNIIGDTKKLSSAWEGVILNFGKADGLIVKLSRGIVQLATKLLGGNKATKEHIDLMKLENKQMDESFEALKSGTLSREAHIKLIGKINTEYGDYLPNLLTEKSTLEEIKTAQDAANKAYKTKIIQQAFQEEINKLLQEELNIIEGAADAEIAIAEERAKIADDQFKSNSELFGAQSDQLDNIDKLNKSFTDGAIKNNKKEVESTRDKFKKIAELYKIAFEEIEGILDETTKTTDENTTSIDENTEAIIKNSNALKGELILKKLLDKLNKKRIKDMYDEGKALVSDADEILSEFKTNILQTDTEINAEIEAEMDAAMQSDMDAWAKKEKTKTKKTEEENEKRKAIVKVAVQGLSDIGSRYFDLEQTRLDAELESVRANYDAQIQAAEGNNELQKALSKELAQKQWEIDLKQFESKRQQALFEIAINTAIGVSKALAEEGAVGILTGLLVTASGLLQVAAVESQPAPAPPAFAKGTKSTPDTFIAGDKPNNGSGNSQELIITKDGKMLLTPNHATLYEGMAESTVIPADQTKQILNTVNMANAGVISTRQMEGKLDEIKEAVVQSESKLSLDKRGIVTLQRGNNAMVTKLNTRI